MARCYGCDYTIGHSARCPDHTGRCRHGWKRIKNYGYQDSGCEKCIYCGFVRPAKDDEWTVSGIKNEPKEKSS